MLNQALTRFLASMYDSSSSASTSTSDLAPTSISTSISTAAATKEMTRSVLTSFVSANTITASILSGSVQSASTISANTVSASTISVDMPAGNTASVQPPTTPAATHTVQVGSRENPHQYSPPNITAAEGDVIVFEFYPANHSVAKADFLAPCVPASSGLFYSGQFNTFNEQNGQLIGQPPTWSLVVNDTEPTFFYCTAINSCTEYGMVGVINPNATMTWEAQYNKALKYPYMLVPGQSPPAEGTGPGSQTAPSSSSSSSSPPSPNLSSGAIAGIFIGALAFLGILAALFIVLGRNLVYRRWMSSEDGRTNKTASWALLNDKGTIKDSLDKSIPPLSHHPAFASSPNCSQATNSPPQLSAQWNWETPANQQHQQFFNQPSELEAINVVRDRPASREYRLS